MRKNAVLIAGLLLVTGLAGVDRARAAGPMAHGAIGVEIGANADLGGGGGVRDVEQARVAGNLPVVEGGVK